MLRIDSHGSTSYQIVSASTGQCITDISKSTTNFTHYDDPTANTHAAGPVTADIVSGNAIVFDVKASLGWQNGAKVRDLWAKRDLGKMMTIRRQLTGDGDSAMYRLTMA